MSTRPPKKKSESRLSTAIRAWLPTVILDDADSAEELLAEAPKRWTIYEPMVLLPSGSFTSPRWVRLVSQLAAADMDDLWRAILRELSHTIKGELTHIAITAGIPLNIAPAPGPPAQDRKENVLRSPQALRTVYGDFGPAEAASVPTAEDFARAFWVSTSQNGICQTWAPRWTMFSRGNVKEKARLLGFGPDDAPVPSTEGPAAPRRWAVDLYAGIGYFVFSYAKLGLRVLGWELNPWSVEGLRRGAARNGWSVRVVAGADLLRPTGELMGGGERIVVFLEDNAAAARRIAELRAGVGGETVPVDILHVNCGFLPSSEATWRPSLEMARGGSRSCWLHLHENVGVHDIPTRKAAVQRMFIEWAADDDAVQRRMSAQVAHVELVKTFAPDVWHCVFDVSITQALDGVPAGI